MGLSSFLRALLSLMRTLLLKWFMLGTNLFGTMLNFLVVSQVFVFESSIIDWLKPDDNADFASFWGH